MGWFRVSPRPTFRDPHPWVIPLYRTPGCRIYWEWCLGIQQAPLPARPLPPTVRVYQKLGADPAVVRCYHTQYASCTAYLPAASPCLYQKLERIQQQCDAASAERVAVSE